MEQVGVFVDGPSQLLPCYVSSRRGWRPEEIPLGESLREPTLRAQVLQGTPFKVPPRVDPLGEAAFQLRSTQVQGNVVPNGAPPHNARVLIPTG